MTSINDINLSITAGGKTAYYCGVKGCGHLIWDIRFGLFETEKAPDPACVLDFALQSEEWEGCIGQHTSPLPDPHYGHITVDFDQKTVVDDNGYGMSTHMFVEWFLNHIRAAQQGRASDGLISSTSVVEHLQQRRIALVHRTQVLRPNDDVAPVDIPQDLDAAEAVVSQACACGEYPFVSLQLPAGWTYRNAAR